MKIIEEKVIIDGENQIGATISYTDNSEKKPLVLLIMGTGKTNRDGNMKGFKTDIYKNLSDMFVNMGYVCVRYDKRGTYESSGNYKTAGLSDLVKDSVQVIDYVKKLDFVDENKIIACGHSEGAMIATLLTKMAKLDRIILLGGACMCMHSAMTYQSIKAMEEFKNKKGLLSWYITKVLSKEKIEKQINSLFEKAKHARKDRFFFNGAFMNTKWVKEHGELTDDDFIKMIEEYNGKVLAITGTADLSADYTYLDRIKQFENVTVYTPQNVNHILREVDDNNSYLKVKKQYKRLSQKPIHKETQKQIEEFLEL